MTDDNVELRLQGEVDATKWAREFQRIAVDGGLEIDQELMLGWFANAIMAGFDYARSHPEKLGNTVVVVPSAVEDIFTPPHASQPFQFTYTDGQGSPCDNPYEGHLTLHEAVFQTLGYASMCWSETPSGVFDSSAVKQAGESLIAYIEDML